MLDYVTLLQDIIFTAEKQLRQLSEAEMCAKPRPNKWSKKELLGHLIDSAYNNHQRFLRAATQGNLIFQGYDPDDWVLKNAYQERDSAAIITFWVQSNIHLACLIKTLSPKLLTTLTTAHNFDQIGMNKVEPGDAKSLGYLIWDYLHHIEYHMVQLLPNYTKRLPAYIG